MCVGIFEKGAVRAHRCFVVLSTQLAFGQERLRAVRASSTAV